MQAERPTLYHGTLRDRCVGKLEVMDRHGRWVAIERGRPVQIEPRINERGYWFWRDGRTCLCTRWGEFTGYLHLQVMHCEDGSVYWDCWG